MARAQHWYLRGWVYEPVPSPDGKPRRRLTYCGESYQPQLPERRFRRLKVLFAVLTLLICVVYLLASLCGSAGARTYYAGAGGILALIPLIFLVMGAVCLLGAPYRMTCRAYHASIRRLLGASAFALGLLTVSALGEGIFLLLHARSATPVAAGEWGWLGGCLLSAAGCAVIFVRLRRLRFDILPGRGAASISDAQPDHSSG